MRKIMTIFILFSCLMFILPNSSFGQYVVGNNVTNFTLNDVDGTTYNLYDYMGEVVLLNFYTTW